MVERDGRIMTLVFKANCEILIEVFSISFKYAEEKVSHTHRRLAALSVL
jgi:hypothetical protein